MHLFFFYFISPSLNTHITFHCIPTSIFSYSSI